MSDEIKSANSESQGAQLDSVVQEILADGEESQATTPVKKEQPEGQDQSGENDGQLEKYQIQEQEYETLTKELGYNDEDLNEFSREDVTNILETKIEKPKVVEEEQTLKEPKPVDILNIQITPAIAEKFGYAKSLIGKPISEAFKTIDNQNKFVQKLQTDYNLIKEQLNKTEKNEADELLKELLNTDPVDLSKEEFGEKLTQLVETVKKGTSPKEVEPEKAQVNEQEFYAEIQSQIPGTMKAEEVAEKWWASLTPEKKDVYSKTTIEVTADAIKNYALINLKDLELQTAKANLQESEKDKEKKIRLMAGEKLRKTIQDAKNKPINGSKFQIVSRKVESPYEGMDIIAREILEDAQRE